MCKIKRGEKMKKCDKSDKCIWGNREHPGYCSYDLGLKDKTLCPKETDDFETYLVKLEKLVRKVD